MLELQEQGATNVNLVTPLHYAPHLATAIVDARAHGLSIPIVCNTSGYESPEVVRAMGDLVDVWLTDFKYVSKTVAGSLSRARDYPQTASEALREMLRQLREKGGCELSATGLMQRGIIVRHLVLPGHIEDSFRVLDMVWDECGNEVDVSIMSQYTPNETCRAMGGPLSQTLDRDEYDLVVCHADDLGFEHIWWQDGEAADESFIPPFDDTGVRGPEL
jgi:putative pyruvate formate lyase activating enzyme